MFYTHASIHHQLVTEEELHLAHHFWYVYTDISYGIRKTVTIFQNKLECLIVNATEIEGDEGSGVPGLQSHQGGRR